MATLLYDCWRILFALGGLMLSEDPVHTHSTEVIVKRQLDIAILANSPISLGARQLCELGDQCVRSFWIVLEHFPSCLSALCDLVIKMHASESDAGIHLRHRHFRLG